MVFPGAMNEDMMAMDPMISDAYSTPSSICFTTSIEDKPLRPVWISYICSLYGHSPKTPANAYMWWDLTNGGWDEYKADYYVGDEDGIGSVDIKAIYPETLGQWTWDFEPSSTQLCLDQTNVLAVQCEDTQFCLQSGEYCAMDLDCCQSPGDHMFCHPVLGYCVKSV